MNTSGDSNRNEAPVRDSAPLASRPSRIIEGALALYIVVMLTSYAIGKIFQTQFANRLEPYRYELRASEFSTEGLFWFTYGHAPVYETMLGLVEALCVVLVFFRRTRPIGALLTLAVMSNVAAMNISFDISAKFNAVSLAVAALILTIMFAPLYRRWMQAFAYDADDGAFSSRALKAGLILKTVLLVLAIASSLSITAWIRRSLDASNTLFGRWAVVSVNGTAPRADSVAALEPGAIVMFNRLNVLAVRSGELFNFGSYEENDASSVVTVSLRRVSVDQSHTLPPPGQRVARAAALAKYPLGYNLSGNFVRKRDSATLRLLSGTQPLVVQLRRM